jgi:glyceraldehyde-3-phosphate dehydrogenase/erythrose-4-phosphate dehydrogenase
MLIRGDSVRVSSEMDPTKIDWSTVDVVVESTGKFTKKADAAMVSLCAADELLYCVQLVLLTLLRGYVVD